MFTKMLLRSVATSVAAGSVFAASLVATPALVATAPEIRTVACDSYAAEAPTTTTLTLARAAGQYGAVNRATATVTDGSATPTGSVRFTIYDQTTGTVTPGDTVELTDGQATLQMSRYLRANRTYMVTANYLPDDSCEFRPSDADAKFYTVYKRRTTTDVNAPNRRVRQPVKVGVVVSAPFQEGLGGKARVVITRSGKAKVLRSAVVRLTDRRAVATLTSLRPGLYTAKVRYLGHVNYAASSGADSFRVR